MQLEMMVRICDTCKKPLHFHSDGTQEGVLCCDLYYHEGDCLNASFKDSGTTWDEHYTEEGDCYYSEWEPLQPNNEPLMGYAPRETMQS